MIQPVKPTPKETKWVVTIFGIVNSAIAISQFFQADVTSNWGLTQGIILVVAGPLMTIYGIILFSETEINNSNFYS